MTLTTEQQRYKRLVDKIWYHHTRSKKFKKVEKIFRSLGLYAIQSNFKKPNQETLDKIQLELSYFGLSVGDPAAIKFIFEEYQRIKDLAFARLDILCKIQLHNNVSGLTNKTVEWFGHEIEVLKNIERLDLTQSDKNQVVLASTGLIDFFLNASNDGVLWVSTPEGWDKCASSALLDYIKNPFVFTELYTLDDTLYLAFGNDFDNMLDDGLMSFNTGGKTFALTKVKPPLI